MAEDFDRFEMLDTYLLETSQILEELQAVILQYKDAERFPKEALEQIFRNMHTMKGSAGFMMFEQMHALAHKTEDIFYYLRENEPEGVSQAELIEKVLKVIDFIQGELDRLSDGQMADTSSKELIDELDSYLASIKEDKPKDTSGETVKAEAPTQIYIAPKNSKASHYYQIYITYKPGTELCNVHAYKVVHALRNITEDIQYRPSTILSDAKSSDEILDQGFKILLKSGAARKRVEKIVSEGYETNTIEVTEIDAARYEAGLDLFGVDAPIAAKITSDDEVYVPGDFVVHNAAPGRGRSLAKDSAKRSTHVNVDEADLEKLSDLLMKLTIARDRLLNDKELKGSGLTLKSFNKNADKLKAITSDMETVITNMRMVPLTNTFLRMNRIIFEASRKLGKDIECVIIGDEIKADRGIIEHISEPLLHMVRNSADHGIETEEVRLAAGKNAKGRITIEAHVSDGELAISVKDDGAGMDRDVILAKAKSKGLIDESKPDSEYTDEEVYRFITIPGFSTNENVTEFSGRGVGMDVVLNSIEQIGGRLTIESTKGQGTNMTMHFSLNM